MVTCKIRYWLERIFARILSSILFPSIFSNQNKQSSTNLVKTKFEGKSLKHFMDQPYVLIPKDTGEWYVVVPKFIDMQVGWLEKSTKSYNVFVVNQYIAWLTDIPNDLQEKLGLEPPRPVRVQNGAIFPSEYSEEFWERYRRYLYRREEGKIRIQKGYEFRLLAAMIRDSFLPFPYKKVDSDLLQEADIGFSLRDYQRRAWEKFRELGALGVYWPFGAGKTFLGLYAIAHLKGPKLVVVPTRTLKEQWIERLDEYVGRDAQVTVETYRSYSKVKDKEYNLVVFDECHRLPANTFSRLATLKTKYRLGLSATPYREDGRTEYIFALTGYPIGIDWNKLFEQNFVRKPVVTVYLFETPHQKKVKLEKLLKEPMKTLIFCDSIELGKNLSEKHDIPFVYGETTNRLEIIRKNQTAIVSRVGDEGLSVHDIERVIEIDFLYGSRRQEAQRVGRLLHSQEPGQHIVLMTDGEFERFEKRFYSLYEKGFKIDIIH